MKTYKYTDATNKVAHVIDEDGISRMSIFVSSLPDVTTIQPADPITPYIPQSVTMRQARLALLNSGKLSLVDAAINSMPEPPRTRARIEWDYSNEVRRDNVFISDLATAIGMTSEDIDDLFIEAATL